MVLKKEVVDGVALSQQEIKEMVNMVRTGKYYIREILEYFGLSKYEYDCYMKVYNHTATLYQN